MHLPLEVLPPPVIVPSNLYFQSKKIGKIALKVCLFYSKPA